MRASHCTPEQFEQHFREVLRQAAAGLFATVDPDVCEEERDDDPDCDCAGVVGFVGPCMSGMLCVAMGCDGLDDQVPADPDDWMGELANQLAGRVKNQLGRVGVTYTVGPPVTLRGRMLSFAEEDCLIRFAFRASPVTFVVHARLELTPPIEIVEPDEEPLEEGRLLFF